MLVLTSLNEQFLSLFSLSTALPPFYHLFIKNI
ncbi:hypothetical protein BBUWI9123_0127 [Borreliella burgdorferi WI91-23]|nr:hypothetical protein BBU72A_0118 [Borreliella burgdorferi 72a]EEF82526.1 hypothetical protein BBUWI9123_0127 [Borreliella burgdorferi WI91-23]